MVRGIMTKVVSDMDEIKKDKITLRRRGQITIPREFINELDLKEGETLEIRVEDGKIVIVPTISVAKDQAWFWKEDWQREEREVENQIQNGNVSKPMTVDEASKFLDQLKE
jgi:AbrB family looped-hinge helix DNA binding protein